MNHIPINLLEIHYSLLSGITGGMEQYGIFMYDKYFHYEIGCLFTHCIALSFTEHLN